MGVMTLLQEIAASVLKKWFFSILPRLWLPASPSTIAPALFYLSPSVGSYLLRPCSRRNDSNKEALIYEKSLAIMYPTHPPRLSGFDREAQPWRVFLCQKKVKNQHKRLAV